MPLLTYPTRARNGSPADRLRAVEQRLGEAERELCVQFARIAQMQAALDLAQAALRRFAARDDEESGRALAGSGPFSRGARRSRASC